MLKNPKYTIEAIRNNLRTYIRDNNIKSLVVGVSGGIDSALACALAFPICTELDIPLIGRSIPITTNKEDEISRAYKVGNELCSNFDEVYIKNTYTQCVLDITEQMEMSPIQLGNIKARLRMIYLYNLAYANRGMVLSTDNYTELLLGFSTLHGDVGDYGMFQYLWKTEVYQASNYIVNEEDITNKQREALLFCISATPTDGLGISNSDLDQLGADSYEEVDRSLQLYLEKGLCEEHPVVQRYLKTMYKRNNPYNIPREQIV